jgi:hypothetical protein
MEGTLGNKAIKKQWISIKEIVGTKVLIGLLAGAVCVGYLFNLIIKVSEKRMIHNSPNATVSLLFPILFFLSTFIIQSHHFLTHTHTYSQSFS